MNIWFQEEIDDGVRLALRAENVLFRGKSEFQTVDVIETTTFGRTLVIDGCVMVTDEDECVYHESIAHIPMLLHPGAQKIVVIGGGDGGTIRELLKHPEVEEITLCEIDALVIEASRKYFPKVAYGLDHPKVKINVGDGVQYMKDHKPESLDLVIIDSTDPVGVGEGLFSGDFYQAVARSLKPKGLMVCQSESPWHDKKAIQRIHNNVSKGFKYIRPYVGGIPTYPRGLWSWTMASNSDPIDPLKFNREKFKMIQGSLEYLSEELVTGTFALPVYFKKKLGLS